MPLLDETITAGQTGHLADSQKVHASLNRDVHLDMFQTGGLTDEQLLTAALDYIQAEITANRPAPTLVLGPRLHTFTTTRTPFNGMRIVGCTPGPKNPEIDDALGGTTVRINVGSGTSSWWNGNGANRYDIYFGNMTITSTNSVSQFWHQSTNSLFACQFHSLCGYGLKHFFGTPTAKCLITQVIFSGHWAALAGQDVQFTVGGSDNELWVGGYLNMGEFSVAGTDRYLMEFSTLSKTNVGRLYLTANGTSNWRGLKISGTGEGLHLWGPSLEGLSADRCNGTLLRIEGGRVGVHGPWIAYAMGAPDVGENGVIEVTGGHVVIHAPAYDRGATDQNTPFVYQSGGVLAVRDVLPSGTWTELPRVQTVGGTLRATDGSWES